MSIQLKWVNETRCMFQVSEPGQADSSVRYCGTVAPPLITSAFTSLIVHFVTDDSINGYGFNATYWFEKGK